MLPSLYLFYASFFSFLYYYYYLGRFAVIVFRSSFKSFFHGCIQVKQRTVMNLQLYRCPVGWCYSPYLCFICVIFIYSFSSSFTISFTPHSTSSQDSCFQGRLEESVNASIWMWIAWGIYASFGNAANCRTDHVLGIWKLVQE